jgi:hypothetical protein
MKAPKWLVQDYVTDDPNDYMGKTREEEADATMTLFGYLFAVGFCLLILTFILILIFT